MAHREVGWNPTSNSEEGRVFSLGRCRGREWPLHLHISSWGSSHLRRLEGHLWYPAASGLNSGMPVLSNIYHDARRLSPRGSGEAPDIYIVLPATSAPLASFTTVTPSNMPPRPSSWSLRQLRRLNPLRDDEEISAPSTSRRVLSDVTDPAWLEPPRSPDPSIHIGVDHPGWERLIRSPLATNEWISLISTIFSNRDEIEMARNLNSGDAQQFIDVIHGVRSFFHLQRIDLLLTLTRTSAVFRSDVG